MSDRSADPGKEHRDKGFFESAWDVVKSVPAAAVEMLTPHSRAEKEAQIQKALQFADRFVSAHQGGDEAAKKAANDELMLALPGGSTIYKAKEGNYAGAAGDIAGMAVLGGVAKAAANPAETAATVRTARRATSGFGEGFKESISKAPPSKPGQIVGRIVGGVVGHKTIGGLEGSAGGGYAGGEIGSRLPAVPSAVRAGIGKAILRLQQENLPERPAPAWQRIAGIPENAPSPLADLSAQLQAAIDEMNARALERQGPAAPPPPARPAPAWQRIETTPETPPAPLADLSAQLQALVDERNARALERQAPVESRPAAAAAPATVPPVAAAPAAPAGLPPMEEILAAPPARGTMVSPALLEDVAQGQAGKPYSALSQADQVKVIEIARRIQSEPAAARPNLPPEEPPTAAIAASPETVPTEPPVGTLAETPATVPAAEPNVFVKNARLAKAVRVADAAQELGLTREDAYKMIADVEKRNEFAKRIGEKSISPDTMALVVDKIAKAESAAARAAAPAPKPTPVAQALAKFKAEKAKKPKAK